MPLAGHKTAELFLLTTLRLWLAAHRRAPVPDWRRGLAAAGLMEDGAPDFDMTLRILIAGVQTLDSRPAGHPRLGAHLHDLFNDVLDLSRVEAGKHEIFEEMVEPAKIVDVCLAMMSARARDEQIDLAVSIPEALPALRADPRAMKQVLLNLLSNAIKYTPAGGRVVTSLQRDAGGLVVKVSDTGCGISEKALAKVFDPFQRGDSMVARKIEGTGLGLAISRKLMELHGGTLTLASRLGAGTTATALFPAERLLLSTAGTPRAAQ